MQKPGRSSTEYWLYKNDLGIGFGYFGLHISFTYPSGPAGISAYTEVPRTIRTPDHLVKSQMLSLGTLRLRRSYLAELRAHW